MLFNYHCKQRDSSARVACRVCLGVWLICLSLGVAGCGDSAEPQPQLAPKDQAAKLLNERAPAADQAARQGRLANELVALGDPGLAACVAALDSPNAATVELAAAALSKFGKPGRAALLAALPSSPEQTQQFIVAALARVKDRQAAPVLLKVLADAPPERRVATIGLLGGLNDPAAVEPLAELFITGTPEAKRAACDALKLFGARAINTIVPMLTDPLTEMYVAEVLGATGSPVAARHLARALGPRGDNEHLVKALVQIGPSAVSVLTPMLDDASRGRAQDAGEALSHIPDPRVVLPLLRHGELMIRSGNGALDRLVTMPQVVEKPALRIVLVSRESDETKAHAVWLLGQIKSTHAVSTLITLIQAEPADDADAQRLKREAAIALGQIGDRRAIRPLLLLLDDPTYAPVAARALAAVGDEQMLPVLRQYKTKAEAAMQADRNDTTVAAFENARDALEELRRRVNQ